VHVAEAPPDGPFGPPEELTPHGDLLAVAMDDRGAALAVWIGAGLLAAVHAPGRAFGRPELVASAADQLSAARAAFEPGGRPRIAWLTAPAHGEKAVIRTSLRPPPEPQ
jgi:hypothetical protein